ncbi:amino acid adenylation domain-containing protein [Mycoavidus sp. HKI]|uniref:non-ribosomal peptide synthetase n=1 Tax=Mycoavidus sp. HKI TaxID=2840467 RepID=UPI001CBC8EB3|nr:non-ribosomal peptide synthetase [Mycoavidus sp. HKI]UAW63736.1 amino acid adenylation domain-containing protein [Mycoavidus sp. HKI]
MFIRNVTGQLPINQQTLDKTQAQQDDANEASCKELEILDNSLVDPKAPASQAKLQPGKCLPEQMTSQAPKSREILEMVALHETFWRNRLLAYQSDSPTLKALAHSLSQHREVATPPNLITADTTTLTPEMLPLIDLSQTDIDRIIEKTPSGVSNIQDIYALSPLQEGILFHHLAVTEGDPYLLIDQLAFDSRALLDGYLDAVQQVVKRHDILRTAFVWEQLSTPAQVVWRDAPLSIETLSLNSANGPIAQQLLQHFDPRQYRIDLTQAPLLRFAIAQNDDGRWLLVQLMHHLIGDHTAIEIMNAEVRTLMKEQKDALSPPQPFRDLVAQARLGASQEAHERFFTEMLAEVDEPTLPFGLSGVHRDGSQVTESRRMLPQELNNRLRVQAKRLSVSLASLCHLAWAQVLARTSGQQQVVFGTVLLGRMQGGADRALGLFMNTLPLRIDLDQMDVESSVRDTHAQLAALLEHEHAPLALAQRCSSVPAGTPLFSALLNYRHKAVESDQNQIFPGIEWLHKEERTNYPFALSVEDSGTRLGLTTQVALPIESVRVCGYMQEALQSLVEALEHKPKLPVHQLEVLPVDERELLLQTWNSVATPYPAHQCMHQLFEAQVARTPEAIVLVYEDQKFSYAELNARANRLAHQLIELGVQPDVRVALCVKRSPALLIGLLAILKAGGVYVPLDPTYPSERLTYILADVAPTLFLADATGRAALGEAALAGQTVLDPSQEPLFPATNPYVAGLTSCHLAYVIYTSGSTGAPKGVMVEHRSVSHFMQAQQAYLDIQPTSRVLQFVSISFDVSVSEIMTLAYGASLYLPPDNVRLDRYKLWEYLEKNAITHASLPPALLQDGHGLPHLSLPLKLLLGGEAPSPRLLQNLTPQCMLFNVYGPTETTVWSTVWHCPRDFNGEAVSIGRPLANIQFYLLNKYGQPVPLGAVGEICIGGAGVTRGYLNQPELTDRRFIADPFSKDKNARLYKTGDLARYLPDGNLEFLGRNDFQVKIRGFRIELGEIEVRLVEHPQVREAAVLALGEGNDKRLVAYVVAEPDEHLAQALRTHLAARLPEYMVPAAFVHLEAFPLTPNGKLNRKALPAPDEKAFAHQAYEAPQGETEHTLAAIWSELLRVERIGRHDNFFALGGHSLLAVQMIERLRHLGSTLSAHALFGTHTLSTLARSLGQHQEVMVPPNLITADAIKITPEMLPLIDLSQTDIDRIVEKTPGGVSNIQDIYALSPLQEGILFHHLAVTEGDPYLLIDQLAFDSRTLLDGYLDAVRQVVERHDVLRTAFVWEQLSTPAQIVRRDAPLSIETLSLDSANGPIAQQLLQHFDPRRYRMDLTQAPLLRFAIAQNDDGRWLLVQLMHHLIGDHTATEIMNAEVRTLMKEQKDALSPPQPFRDLVAQARLGASQEAHEHFFTEMLAEVDEPTLPFGLSGVHRDGSQVTESRRMLPQELNNRLRVQAKRLSVGLASLCHLAWAQVLARTSGQQRVVFGTVLLGRMQGGADRALGLFMNTLPLRIDLDQMDVESSVRDTHAQLAALLEHEHASLALAQRCSSVPAGTPLFSALLNYRHNTAERDKNRIFPGIEWLHEEERTNYPFVLSVDDSIADLGLTAQVVHPFDPVQICGYMQQTLQSLVEALERMPKMPVHQLEVLPVDERELLLQTWNSVVTPYPAHQCMHQLFEEQVERTPEAIALVYEEQEFSYAELNAQANRVAHQLIKLGVQPDTRVAICMDRSPALVVGLLAILKAGGAYVPLDPAYSSERLTHILTDAAPAILLADTAGRAALGESELTSLTVLDPNSLPPLPSTNPKISTLSPHHLAYIIYTSGSTGLPKGVMVEHAQITRLFDATADWYQFNQHDVWCLFHSFAFDVSVWELWGALRHGGKLVIVPHHIARSPQDFYHLLCKQGVTVLNQTPSAFKPLIDCHAQSKLSDRLRYVIFAGEALEPAVLQTWYAVHAEHSPQLVNMYGTTETTVHATYRLMQQKDSHQIGSPVGKRIPDLKIYLLDANRQPVPLGAIGEIYIGGAGVARGYLNRPKLSAERFVADPFSKDKNARLYRTGDLARYLPDGELEFLGRNDFQVKIRGFRIELGEIEARLADHPQVREAAVLALGEGSDKRLVAYVVAKPNEHLAQALRTHLAARLPEYMVPAAFVRLEAFPLTPNGKLDRKALPAPDVEALARQTYEVPQGEIEQILAAIWTELLGVERISRHDNFFALGGHSLLAVQMIERLRRAGLTLSVRTLFDKPTLSILAQSLGQHQEIVVPPNLITRDTIALKPELLPLIQLTQTDIDGIVEQTPGGVSNIQDIYALSPLQDGILFHHLMATEGDPYLLLDQLAFASRALLDRYLDAVQQVVKRHDILRTAFVWEQLSTPAQVVWRDAPLSIETLSLDSANGPIAQQLLQHFDPRRYRMDLTQAPLLRFAIAQDDDGRWLLVQLMHHLIGDHSTLEVMGSEVQAWLKGQGSTLSPAQSFRNLIAQVRLGVSQEAHERFFREMLSEVDEPTLPFGLTEVHRDGSQITESYRMLPQDLNDRLRTQAKRLNVSLASLCHLAWAQVLARTSGQQQVVFGTVLFGRMQGGMGADQAMGLFINTLPLRIDLDETEVEESVGHVHARLAALLEHEHASLALAQRCSSVPAGTPLFSALLNYRHNAAERDKNQIFPGIEWLHEEERTNYPFVLSVDDSIADLGLTAQVVHPFDPVQICGYMQQTLQSLVEALERMPKVPVHQLEVLPVDERELLLQTWNSVVTPYPAHQCMHQLFEAQVERTPEAIALVYEEQEFSYAELNAQANRVAHQLIKLGVQPDTRVAICMDRSPALVVGLLAILKAGGAYVPLDPAYSSERLTHILTDAAPAILLADTVGRAALGESELASLTVLDPNSLPPLPSTNPKISTLSPHHLAYIIYTSGSTGLPKGVMVEHAQITRLFDATADWYQFNQHDVWCLFHSFAFDFSVWELWGALRHGGKLVIVPHHIARSPQDFYHLLCEQGVTVLNQTPSAFKPLIDCQAQSKLSDSLRYVIFGGEALEPTVLQMWYATRAEHSPQLVNMYGITETTVHVTYRPLQQKDSDQVGSPVGKRIPDLKIYLLDANRQLAPLGAVGELYIGGAGVARGYLNRPELTAQRFVADPFSKDKNARLYRTGDLARYLPDGNLEFLGRNDFQVKIRGFRIELGEIEARLADHPQVREAAVLALEEGNDKRLVAYVVAKPDEHLAQALRTHLAARLPEYMVPAAFVRLEAFPLTPNGKLDRKALPAPDVEALARQTYEVPQGEIEQMLAAIWTELLGVERISRHDNFFALGGHSLLAVQMIERLRRVGLTLSVRALFDTPTLSFLARSLRQHQEVAVPPNLITPDTTELTPDLLALIQLTQTDIDHIVEQTPGGVANIQDIYALSPLQDGILLHHLMATEGDPYLLITQMAFDSRALLDRYLDAVQQVVKRHDILRTAFIWEQLSTPAQVVWRDAPLSIEELSLDSANGPIPQQQLQYFDPRRYRMDLTQAPLLRFAIAQDDDGRWLLVQLLHHLIDDNSSMRILNAEVQALLKGQGSTLPPAQSFRNLIAQVRLGVSQEAHERFFREMLGEVDEPTLPFGLAEVHREGSQVTESYRMLPQELNDRLRMQAKRLNVSLASLCHLAWAQVLARTSGQQQVVFGTVLFGRMQGGMGVDQAMGLFINTLPMRIDLDETEVEESVRHVHARLAALLEHEHASLALAQRCSSVPAGTPLFSALLNYRYNAVPSDTTQLMPGIEELHAEDWDSYSLSLSVDDYGQSLGLTAQIAQPFNPERLCGYMQKALESLAETLERAPKMPVRQLEIVPNAEQALLLQTWNATAAPYPKDQCLHQLFEAQVERTPNAIALAHENLTISYAELNAQANRLAHHLIDIGVRPDSRVALYIQPSIDMVMGLLAVLKAGGAYVPLDTKYPAERLADMVNDSVPVALLSIGAPHTVVAQGLGEKAPVLDLRADMAHWKDKSSHNPSPHKLGLNAEHLAYVMYTSGSTGKPKGVMIQHQGVVSLAITMIQQTDLSPQDRVLQFSSLSFDTSVSDIFATLTCGATLVLRTDAWLADTQEFWRLCEANQISVMELPTQFWAQLAQEKAPVPQKIRLMMIGGDALSASAHQAWFVNTGHRPRLLNTYGPTETTVNATIREVSADGNDWRAIGRPITNTRVYVLDSSMQPTPLGVAGELYIGGAGVARGYLNRPDLTAERFLSDPFSDQTDAWMYRTGDLVRYLPDGNLEFLGRNDYQVKIRGFRIELGEIEARLTEHPQVREAVVAALGEGSNKRLVAYVVAKPDEHLVQSLRTHIAVALPEYMVPAAFVRLETFPLMPNGKLDRKALPAPDVEALARQTYEVPQGEVEQMLAAIWTKLLDVERISRHDNFFALGGHSLLAVQMIERLRRAGLTLSVRTLFDKPTLSILAQSLGQHQEIVVPPNLITRDTIALKPELLPLIQLTQTDIDGIVEQTPGGVSNIQDIYALSPLQDGILFHHLMATEGDPYLLLDQLAFASRALLDRYLDAVQQVVKRHDILRTAFVWEQLSTPAQVVWRDAPLSIETLSLDSANGPIAQQLLQHFDPRRYRMDLTQAPLLRFAIAQDDDGRWLLVESSHHLISDHSTGDVMDAEVRAFVENQSDALPAAQPFRNLVAQARLGVSQEAHERFFREMLGEVDEPTLPFGLTEVHRDGSQVTESHRMLPQELNNRLRMQAKRLNVSLASLCHLAWAQVLARTSGQQRVVFSTVLFGRMRGGEGADQAMGLFINTLPLRIDLDETGVEESVRHVHARLAALLEHEHASLALAQRCSNVPAGTPLFSAMLNYRHNMMSVDENQTMSGVERLYGEERTNYPFLLSIEDFSTKLGLTAQVAQPFDPAQVCGYMQEALLSLVNALEYTPKIPVHQLEVLPVEERKLLLQTWNATETSYPAHQCIHQLFEEQVERTPESVALVYGDQQFSYAELNAQANRLAYQLIECGVQPDTRVALCAERSPAIVVGLLATLKAGGVYVPLDPVYPSERLAHILAHAAPKILLADRVGRTALGEEALAPLIVLDPNELPKLSTANPHIPELTSRHLIYVLYTSGSTGKPKGVTMEHRSIVNLAQASVASFGVHPSSRVLQFASISFDVSIWEMLVALSCGASLYLPPETIRHDRDKLWDYLAGQAITHVILPPALLQGGEILPSLSTPLTMVLTGEAPSATLLQNLSRQGTVFNAYGPTETHAVTVWPAASSALDHGVLSIGRPIANTRLYVLDARGQPVPLGAVGELYIGGVGVARGYLDQLELTAERFLRDPFSEYEDARMYKTGDLVRYLPDGNLVFLGRNDHQIKIRGFRIEPGEIEACLAEHPLVQEAVVLAMGEGNDKRLVAYVVAEPDEQSVQSLRAHLAANLPEYMVPAAFVRLDAFPLTSNGKLDRKALPAPDAEALARQVYEVPQGEFEYTLATIWSELLGVERIGRHDNFFALGGHSLLAMQMAGRIRSKLGVEITLRTTFEAPTIAGLAQRLLGSDGVLDNKDGILNNSFDVLLPLQPKGSRSPLFCIHSGVGVSWEYIGLSQYLGEEQPIYGLQARGLDGMSRFAETIDEMAADYIKQIRQIQPSGPYSLLGWSLGGMVAHSMATQLEQQGERVALLAIWDAYPSLSGEEWEKPQDLTASRAAYMETFEIYDDKKIPNASEYLWEKIQRCTVNANKIVKNFSPRIYSGDMLFFHATIKDSLYAPLHPDMWKPYICGEIKVHNINCNHSEMGEPKAIAEISRPLADKLNQLQKSQLPQNKEEILDIE